MESRFVGFRCKYCYEAKSGGDATSLKEHLAHREKDVKNSPSVPHDVKTYFATELDNTKQKKMERMWQRLRDDEEDRTHYDEKQDVHYDDDLQATLHQSWEEH
jgi:hypothetical protein